jgi:hypothetical protein
VTALGIVLRLEVRVRRQLRQIGRRRRRWIKALRHQRPAFCLVGDARTL